MPHPLVEQLRFTRSEWQRALAGLTDEDARRRLPPMNCISWMLGHLAYHEHAWWLALAQGKADAPDLRALVASGQPATTPPLADMWAAWHTATAQSDPYLDSLTTETLQTHLSIDGKPLHQTLGTMIQRVIYHYWFHTGEILAVRQLLGHTALPEFVGDIQSRAPYRPDPSS